MEKKNKPKKKKTSNAGDAGSIRGLVRYPGGGNGNLLQYYFLKNPMDRRPGGTVQWVK